MAGSISRLFSTVELSLKNLLSIAFVGAGVGVLTWLISLLLQVLVIEPIFCQSADSFNACANGGTISVITSTIVANILGLIALVRLGVYRPLLVVLAAIITLFGIHSFVGSMSWYEATAWYAAVYAISYALYAWVARMVSFAVTLAIMLVIVIVLRVFLAQL